MKTRVGDRARGRRRALASLVAVATLGIARTSRAEWHSSAQGVRYFLPSEWAASPLANGTIARGPNGVAVWLLPLDAAQSASSATPEALFGAVLTRPRALTRSASLVRILPTGSWSEGTATFERRSVRWLARVARLDANRAVLAVGISTRAALTGTDAEPLDIALASAHLADAPGISRYAGNGTITSAGVGARAITSPVVLELRGTGEQRTIVVPDLDGMSCVFRARVQPTGALRLEPDQSCVISRIGATMVLVGGTFEVVGGSASFIASGRLSITVANPRRRGTMVMGSVSFNWRVPAMRPAA
jgi:hypothetical protein